MTIYNVVLPIVALVEADSESAAIDKLVKRLDQAGFDFFDDPGSSPISVFESEDQS